MLQAPLIEIFRYVASGFVFLFYLHIANPTVAKQLRAILGDATIAVGALVVGALMYIMYRAFLFSRITRLRDRRGTSYRSWLQERGNLTTRRQAVLLYAVIRPKLGQSTERATHFANVHYGYTASLLAFPFSLFSLLSGRPLFGALLVVFGSVLFRATLLFHQRGEDEELLEVMRFAEERPGTINNLATMVRNAPLLPNDE